jgi:hypothetical protein
MPDITMCANDDCPVRHLCHRHQASGTWPTEHRQSYAVFVGPRLIDGQSVECPDFWPKMLRTLRRNG